MVEPGGDFLKPPVLELEEGEFHDVVNPDIAKDAFIVEEVIDNTKEVGHVEMVRVVDEEEGTTGCRYTFQILFEGEDGVENDVSKDYDTDPGSRSLVQETLVALDNNVRRSCRVKSHSKILNI